MLELHRYVSPGKLDELVRRCHAATGLAVLVLDPEKNVMAAFPGDAPVEDLATSPLSLREKVVAYAAVPRSGGGQEKALDFVVGEISERVETGYELESLSAEIARNYEELSRLWKLSARLGAGLNVDRICGVLADEVMEICPSANVSIMLLSEVPVGAAGEACLRPSGGGAPPPEAVRLFFPKVSLGEDASRASTMSMRADRGLMGQAYKTRGALTVCDVSRDRRFEGLPYHAARILIVPLVVEEAVVGAILATDKQDGEEFYTTEIKLIESIATECAVSIKKALLYDEIHGMLFGIVESFAFALDAKHPYTYGHSKRVSDVSALIAKRLRLPAEAVNWVRLAALLHDMGKIGTPEIILDKETELDPEEMSRIRQHPVVGARMIESIGRMREISTWICHHHEKWDGSGYPSGLKGEEIPLPSRVIAIADYFDALTTDRSYRKAFSKDKAVEMMKETAGKHFDPHLFALFEGEVAPAL